MFLLGLGGGGVSDEWDSWWIGSEWRDVRGDFLGEMGDYVRSPDGVGTVQHAQKKDKSVARIPGRVGPLGPNKGVRSVHGRHRRADDDGDENSGNDEKRPPLFQQREDPIGKKHTETDQPVDNHIGHKDMPPLHHEGRMEHRIHGNSLGPDDLRRSGIRKDPREEIPPSREPAAHAAVPPGRDGSPVVHTTRRRHR